LGIFLTNFLRAFLGRGWLKWALNSAWCMAVAAAAGAIPFEASIAATYRYIVEMKLISREMMNIG
jgi:hypothetical protein